jgi:hypothetical protein
MQDAMPLNLGIENNLPAALPFRTRAVAHASNEKKISHPAI